ncbi:hypothetical protein ACFOOL_14870 [Devosia honganensis]|uniref:TMhelix containing protein n=1 Tax=Devosia honganensis TaxID=1610527 RepID=A0ABV7X5Z4_9HYPH
MNAPRIKNEITIGSLASLLGLIMTILGFGIAIGNAQTDIAALKAGQVQSSADSRALIRLQADMDYLKGAVDELRGRR